MKHKIILNPQAGKGGASSLREEIEAVLTDLNLEFEVAVTERAGHAAELALNAAKSGIDIVVAAGGDGTANEVLNGIMEAKKSGSDKAAKTAMGIITVGRGNDFAYGMNIPEDWRESCRVIAENHRLKVDVGFAKGGFFPDGRYFGNGVGIGFDAVVGFEAAKLKLTGFIAYLVAALRTIFVFYKAPKVEISHDHGREELDTLMVSIMNGRRMGGGFMMAPEGLVNDGLFDICIARQVSKPGIFGLIGRFMKGTQGSHDAIKTFRTRKIAVSAVQGSLPAHADGETLCYEGEKLSVEILPGAVEMICRS